MIPTEPIHGTWTDEGFIPDLERHGIRMPVALDFAGDNLGKGFRRPYRVNGKLAYALPGGTLYIEGGSTP